MKEEYLKKLQELDEDVLKRLVELSENPKALSYLKNPILFATLKMYLK